VGYAAFVQPLLAQPLFQGLRPMQLEEIAKRADRIVYRPGDTLIEEDRLGDAAILIVAGEAVRITDDPSALNEPVVVGSLLGELAMLVETVHSTTVLARTPVRALRFGREDMLELMREDVTIAEHFESRLADRLVEFVSGLAEIDRTLETISEVASAASTAPPPNAFKPLFH
jgi:CRP-like cAMP-binding protein